MSAAVLIGALRVKENESMTDMHGSSENKFSGSLKSRSLVDPLYKSRSF